MTANDFRRLVLGLPDVSEQAHMSHPDFRVAGKIFATLGYPDQDHAVLVLPPADQKNLMRTHPKTFAPAPGAWGRRGSTVIALKTVDTAILEKAIQAAYQRGARPAAKSKKPR